MVGIIVYTLNQEGGCKINSIIKMAIKKSATIFMKQQHSVRKTRIGKKHVESACLAVSGRRLGLVEKDKYIAFHNVLMSSMETFFMLDTRFIRREQRF